MRAMCIGPVLAWARDMGLGLGLGLSLGHLMPQTSLGMVNGVEWCGICAIYWTEGPLTGMVLFLAEFALFSVI